MRSSSATMRPRPWTEPRTYEYVLHQVSALLKFVGVSSSAVIVLPSTHLRLTTQDAFPHRRHESALLPSRPVAVATLALPTFSTMVCPIFVRAHIEGYVKHLDVYVCDHRCHVCVHRQPSSSCVDRDESIFYFRLSASTPGAPGYRHRRSNMSMTLQLLRLVSTAAALVNIAEMI